MIKIEKIYPVILISILVFSGFIYFYRLDSESLSTDEYFSLYIAQKSPVDIISQHKTASNPNTIPPLYVLILHYWLKIFGQSEFAQRSLSGFLGVVSVYFLYALTRLLLNRRTGILSALFGSLSFTWFWLFRQNRCYSLFMLLSLASFYLLFYLIKNKESKRALFCLIAVNILLAYTHYLSFLIIILEAAFGFFQWRKYRRGLINILLMCFIIGVSYLPWYSNLIYDFNREPIIIYRAIPITIKKAISDFFRILFSDFHFEWSPILSVIYLPFIIRGLFRLRGKFLNEFKYVSNYLILIIFIPFIFIFLIMAADRTRYYAPFMFPLLILLAFGFQGLNIKAILMKFLFLAITIFIISNNIMDLADFYNIPNDEEWKQAAALIKRTPDYRGKENVFVFQTRYNPPVFSYYYWEPKAASHFIPNIATKDVYDNDLRTIGAKDKLFVIEDMKGRDFFAKLASFPKDSWIWIFRYHDRYFPRDFKTENENRYFFHQIKLNKELSPIDLFLLKRVKGSFQQQE